MNVILIGPPASGKGTQAKLITEKFNLVHISTGDLIRNVIEQNNELSNKLKEYVNNGKLVPDNLIIDILKDYLKNINTSKGLLFDGFPRTVFQAMELQKLLDIDYVFEINTSLNSIVKRIENRYICSKCGKGHTKTSKQNLVCDYCNEALTKRADDTKEKVTVRYNDYLKITYPVIEFYKNTKMYKQVDGEKSSHEVFEQICGVIESI